MRAIFTSLLIAAAGTSTIAAPRVATDIAPVHSLAAMVMDGVAEPTLIFPADASPHHHALRPSAARALQEADLVFWIGPELNPGFAEAIEVLATKARRTSMLSAPGIELRHLGEDHHAEGEIGQAHHHHSATDPHIWLDPANARAMVTEMARIISQADPGNADRYLLNAESTKARLVALEAQVRLRLSSVRNHPFMAFHDAYGYFTERFGLSYAGAISPGDASRPGAARLATVAAQLETDDIRCIFTEPQLPEKIASAVTEGREVRVGTLDPMGIAQKPGSELYFELINGLATSMESCLGE